MDGIKMPWIDDKLNQEDDEPWINKKLAGKDKNNLPEKSWLSGKLNPAAAAAPGGDDPTSLGVNSAAAANLPGRDSGNILSSGKSSTKPVVDPLLSQLAFLQLVMPFLQQSIQQATGGLQDTASQYQQEMGGVVSNMPQSLQGLYSGVVPGVSNALNNQAQAGAQSALAAPEHQFMMGLVQSVREQQEQNLQNQMLIQQLQQQLSSGGGGATEDPFAALIAEAIGTDPKKK